MPSGQCLLHHRLLGPADAPLLVLGPSLGTSTQVWEPHVAVLAAEFRVLCFDLPGHGDSPSAVLPTTEPARTTVDDLAQLVLDLVDHHGTDRFHYAGISLGGAIGAHLAVHHPKRLTSLALVCSSPYFGTAEPWLQRAALVRREGTAALLTAMPDRWFADPHTAAEPLGTVLLKDLTAADPSGYAACCDALATYDLRHDLSRITAPTLVVGGTRDTATPLVHSRELAAGIPDAVLRTVTAGHLAVEDPDALRTALLAHLKT
ncbi:alpha/beta fold hydrolase [Streptomyces sp. NPDC050523]|uniref:alpha/beta fold hydrolase n=1 Tax=Streptomyces sp. NPDC050523 TaxID=3365622 RepID=UPI00378BA766